MSLFRHILPGQGHGQGQSAVSLLGAEGVPRRGLAGQVQNHAPLSKSATLRTLTDGFGIQHVSNVDLLLRKGPKPDDSWARGRAGVPASYRRGLDFPDEVRATSIEHTLQRRHSAPSFARHHFEKTSNDVIRSITCNEDADRIGRNVRGASRSPPRSPLREFRSLSPPPEIGIEGRARRRSGSPQGERAYSFGRRSVEDKLPLELSLPLELTRSSSATAQMMLCPSRYPVGCTWGEGLAFDAGDYDNIADQPVLVATPFEDDEYAHPDGEVYEDTQRIPFQSNKSATPTTPTTCTGGGRSLCNASSFSSLNGPSSFYNTIQSDTSGDNGYESPGIVSFAKAVDKRLAKIYEKRLSAMVKQEQKKALKRLE